MLPGKTYHVSCETLDGRCAKKRWEYFRHFPAWWYQLLYKLCAAYETHFSVIASYLLDVYAGNTKGKHGVLFQYYSLNSFRKERFGPWYFYFFTLRLFKLAEWVSVPPLFPPTLITGILANLHRRGPGHAAATAACSTNVGQTVSCSAAAAQFHTNYLATYSRAQRWSPVIDFSNIFT